MQKNAPIIIAWVLAAFVVVFIGRTQLGWFSQKPTTASTTPTTATSTTHDQYLGNGVTATGLPEGVSISTSSPNTIKAPSLDRPLTKPADMQADVFAIYSKKVTDLRAAIQKNPNQDPYDNWLTLGSYYQDLGDYEGARLAFQYVSDISPKNAVSFNNLGTLYHYFLKDFPKSEAEYLQAIKNDPTYELTYHNLYDLYHLSYKTNTAAAADIVKQGLKILPGNEDLLQLQSEINQGQ